MARWKETSMTDPLVIKPYADGYVAARGSVFLASGRTREDVVAAIVSRSIAALLEIDMNLAPLTAEDNGTTAMRLSLARVVEELRAIKQEIPT